MKKQTIHYIINPKAGTKHGINFSEIILKYIDLNKFDYHIKYTECAGHATVLALDAVNSNVEYCFAVGGDGTVNEVAQALKNSNTCLGIVPMGSGNGLARHLQIPLDAADAIKLVNSGKILRMDSMLVNGNYSINVSGIGFDAHVASLFGKGGKRGFFNYLKIVLSEFNKYPNQQMQITCDGYTSDKNLFIVAFANSSQFGNNAIIAPSASVVDEYINLVMFHKQGLIKTLLLAPRIFRGKLEDSDDIEMLQVKNINIKTLQPIALHIDGEPKGLATEFKIQVMPSTNNILVPEKTYR